MALTNIELYEALTKTLDEDAARMIAEVSPKAQDLATRNDVALAIERSEGHLRSLILDVERRLDRRISSAERRFFVLFAVPLWGAVAAGIVKLFVR